MMDFYEMMNAAQDTVISISKALLMLESAEPNMKISIIVAMARAIEDNIPDESLKEASIAMIGEEICVKKRMNVTDFFSRIANNDGDLSFYERALLDIASFVVGGEAQAIDLFGKLAPMSLDVLDVCGEYDGGF